MKTFSEFIAEAENTSAQIASLRARANAARQKGDMKTFIELQKQASELGAGTQAKIGAATSDKPKKPTNPNTWVSGTPKSPKGGATSSVGTQSGISRQRITNMRTGEDLGSASTPGVNVSGRYSDTSSRSQGGGRVSTRNKGQGYSSPERGKYSEP